MHSHTKLDLGTWGEGTFGQFPLLMLLQVLLLAAHVRLSVPICSDGSVPTLTLPGLCSQDTAVLQQGGHWGHTLNSVNTTFSAGQPSWWVINWVSSSICQLFAARWFAWLSSHGDTALVSSGVSGWGFGCRRWLCRNKAFEGSVPTPTCEADNKGQQLLQRQGTQPSSTWNWRNLSTEQNQKGLKI